MYQSSNLVKCGALTLADITFNDEPDESIFDRAMELKDGINKRDTQFQIIDTYQYYKEQKKLGIVKTLVDYSDVPIYASYAVELYMKHIG